MTHCLNHLFNHSLMRANLDQETYNAYTTLKMREKNRRRKRRAVEYKGGKCECCGYSRSLAALEFHHTDPSRKDFTVAKASKSWETTKRELDKCRLLCSNCHREEHDRLVEEKHLLLTEMVRKVIPVRGPLGAKVSKKCLQCGKSFTSYEKRGSKYCSKQCKGFSQGGVAISDEELRSRLETRTPVQVAEELGITANSVRRRCREQGIPWAKHRRKRVISSKAGAGGS